MEQPEKDAETLQLIEYLMGFVQDGSDTTITLSQDDATRTYIVTVHYPAKKENFHGNDLHSALFLAVFGE